MPDFDANAFVKEGQDRTAAQQTALMKVIAEQGAAGAQAYAQGQSQVAQSAQATGRTQGANAAGSAVAGSSQFANEEGSRMQAIQGLYQSDLSAGNATFGADIARQGATNSAYMGQVSAAIPIVASQVQSEAQALGEASKRIREKQAHEREMAAMEMQAMREAQSARREGKYDDPLDRRAKELQIKGMERELDQGNPDDQKRHALEEWAAIDSERSRLGPRAQAAYDLLKSGKTPEELQRMGVVNHRAFGRVDLRNLNYGLIQSLVERANSTRRSLFGFGIEV